MRSVRHITTSDIRAAHQRQAALRRRKHSAAIIAAAIHAASLRRSGLPAVQAAPDKQKSPEGPTSEDFTNRSPVAVRSHGGRSPECA